MSAEQDLANANVQIANLISEVTRFRDAAMGINNIWPTITEGRNNTADGKYFSVPGEGAYLKLYRRAGTSQTPIAEFPDRAQVQGIVDVFGGRGLVGGSGRLMAEEAFGIGSTGSMQVLSALDVTTIPSGEYVAQGIPVEQRPPGASGFAYVTVKRYNSGNIRIEYAPIGSQTGGNRKWWKTYNSTSNTFSPWVEVFTTGNILGTVSQSGGVPTGAIIERGSNANGEYVKFADGTLVCCKEDKNGGAGWNFAGEIASQTWSFPFPFLSSTRPFFSAAGGDLATASVDFMAALNSINAIPVTADVGRWSKRNALNWAGSASVFLFAIGRWY